ncbi:hypothetical protein ACG83_12425 [Frankia sp. R43]|uniref:P-loop NTPase fold protein n=1 Tax=Frankia sp. R43 TaxID=269536 RepID=UPI0006DB2223|nr:P-loop NTPase fold protein [Frankia sp. R43]KPM55994.1 hypothetical protein ACG83_12425 [Frankia sp. R43]
MTTPADFFAGHEGAVRAIAVFPDGRRIVTGGADSRIRVWDLPSGRLLTEHNAHTGPVLAVAVDEQCQVVSSDQGKTVVWACEPAAASSAAPSSVPYPRRVAETAVSPRGDTVVSIDTGQDVVVQPPGTGSWPSGHRRVDSIAVSDGGQVVTGGSEPIVRVTDRHGAELRRLDGAAHGSVAVAASHDGSHIAVAIQGAVRYWDTAVSRTAVDLTGCEDPVTLAVTPDGRQVVAGGLDGGIWVWSAEQPGQAPVRLRGHHSAVRAFAVTPDNKRLVSGTDDGTIRLWDLATGARITPGTAPGPLPGHVSDQESALDLLGFATDVEAMAALLADRSTEPPLAIALLGRWGSGKSSFARQLHDRVAALAQQSSRSAARSIFATNIRQVRFDAWHYNDDHLWVGMAEHLFAGLVEPEPSDTEQIRARREVLRDRLRAFEDLAAEDTDWTQRLRARARLWRVDLARWRGRFVLAGAVLVLGVCTGLVGLLWGPAPVVAVGGVVAVLAGFPIVGWLVAAWQAVSGLDQRRVDVLEQQARDTRMQLATLDAAQRLAVVIEQARSGAYDQYRGLLGQVHADLRQLSDSARRAFAEWTRTGSRGRPPLERVILYIDDLDRCSPRRVVDVLAAVHMLLALPLFVVVVAVDPRWLRRCLEQYYAEIFAGNADAAGGATPFDYLDKIFQVVFALRPMGAEADRYVEWLVPTAAEDERPRRREAEPPEARPRPGSGEPDRPGPGRTGRAATPGEMPPQPDQLRLRPQELRFVQRLRPMLETPRALKRFVNLYRLVRAGIPDNELDDFIGTDENGPYQAVLVLLAVLVADPEGGRTLIKALHGQVDGTGIHELIEELSRREQPWRVHDIWARLLALLGDGNSVHSSLPTYRRWAGTTARFSFETWDLTEPR